ncbi:MAG TPA: nicotinate-nucleotide adenylyltransferase [Treponemataceae bacterium]|nr:nicotinate-nucleotide adenylyltransferase [Treponemataceae bacterium]
MRIAVLGGTFNPPHHAHLALADEVACAFGYDRVLLIPAHVPPHKEMAAGASDRDRLAMLHRATRGNGRLAVDDCELKRGGVSFTIDTLRDLARRYGRRLEGRIGLVIGEDLVPGFPSWREADEIARVADVIVATRPGSPRIDFPYRHVRVDNPPLDLSSTEVRARIAGGKPWRYLVSEPVYRYIVGHRLYEHG